LKKEPKVLLVHLLNYYSYYIILVGIFDVSVVLQSCKRKEVDIDEN